MADKGLNIPNSSWITFLGLKLKDWWSCLKAIHVHWTQEPLQVINVVSNVLNTLNQSSSVVIDGSSKNDLWSSEICRLVMGYRNFWLLAVPWILSWPFASKGRYKHVGGWVGAGLSSGWAGDGDKPWSSLIVLKIGEHPGGLMMILLQ